MYTASFAICSKGHLLLSLNRTTIKRLIQQHGNIASDMLLNIVATLVPVIALQLFILPYVARSCNGDKYGLILTFIGLVTLSVQPVAISLTNTRLIVRRNYEKANVAGDFNLILTTSCLLNAAFLSYGILRIGGTKLDVILIVAFSLFRLLRTYLLVTFRLNINYRKMLLSNFLLVMGYGVGSILFRLTNIWQLIYLTGEVCALSYVLLNSRLLLEPFRRTPLFSSTGGHILVLFIASFLGTLSAQADRLLLFPILGANMVAIYFVASTFGKFMAVLIGPVNNVILSYLSKKDELKTVPTKSLIISTCVLCFCIYVAAVLASKYLLVYIYPDLYRQSSIYIYITTLTAVVIMTGNVMNPFVMKFRGILWQIWIYLLNLIVYIVSALILSSYFGLYGFCIAALVAAFARLGFLAFVWLRSKNNINS